MYRLETRISHLALAVVVLQACHIHCLGLLTYNRFDTDGSHRTHIPSPILTGDQLKSYYAIYPYGIGNVSINQDCSKPTQDIYKRVLSRSKCQRQGGSNGHSSHTCASLVRLSMNKTLTSGQGWAFIAPGSTSFLSWEQRSRVLIIVARSLLPPNPLRSYNSIDQLVFTWHARPCNSLVPTR